jgi:hypothetical protein
MRVLFKRAAVIAGAAAVILGSAAGIASAGSAPAISWSPTTSAGSFDFGSVTAGTTTAPQMFKLTNTGGSATAALTVTVTGPAFTLQSDTCTGTSLGPHKSCTVQVSYTASTAGGADTGRGAGRGGTLTAKGVKADAAATVNLQGESNAGSPNIEFSPGTSAGTYFGNVYSFDFGQVASASQTFTATNTGTGPTPELQLFGIDEDGFTTPGDTCTGATLAPGGTCTFVLAWSAAASFDCSAHGSGYQALANFAEQLFTYGGGPSSTVFAHLNVTATCP